MFVALNLVFAEKERFGKHINGRNQTNKYRKSNLIFLQRHN